MIKRSGARLSKVKMALYLINKGFSELMRDEVVSSSGLAKLVFGSTLVFEKWAPRRGPRRLGIVSAQTGKPNQNTQETKMYNRTTRNTEKSISNDD